MKKLLLILLCLPMIFSCGEKKKEKKLIQSYEDKENNIFLVVGNTHQGGTIFYLDGNGGGLIAAPTDQSTEAEWGCEGILISGADQTAIGTGAQNTIDIENGCTTPGTAADICANLTLDGYSDWFLPSTDELNLMYKLDDTRNHEGRFNNFIWSGDYGDNYYWSSTEYDKSEAWLQNLWSGRPTRNKSDKEHVRAVRAF
jgi:hypothetical protein